MYYFIVNPRSSSNLGMKKWQLIEAQLTEQDIRYRVFFTERAGHASELAAMICSKAEAPVIVAVGGDGTANEVINGITDYTVPVFGYIPTGSSNDLARSMNIPADPLAALEIILTSERRYPMNIGHVTTATGDSRSFAVSTGIGYDAAICHEALHSRLKKILNRIKLGKLTYVGIALKQLMLLQPAALELTLDDQETLQFEEIFFAALMNHRYEGGGFMFCPEAQASDGYLDICLIVKMPKWKVLKLLPTAFSGNHVKHKEVRIFRCKKAHLKTPQPLPVHTDGESFNLQSEMTVSLDEKTLSVICAD